MDLKSKYQIVLKAKSNPIERLCCPVCKSRNYKLKFYRKLSLAELICNNCYNTSLVEVYSKVCAVKIKEKEE